jgi:hypothetical protein
MGEAARELAPAGRGGSATRRKSSLALWRHSATLAQARVLRPTARKMPGRARRSAASPIPGRFGRGAVLVASEFLGHLRDLLLLLLLFDEYPQALDRLPSVLSRDAATVAVVATRASGGEIRWFPETGAAPASSGSDGGRLLRSRCSAALRSGRRSRSGRARRGGAFATERCCSGDHSFEDHAVGHRFGLWRQMPDGETRPPISSVVTGASSLSPRRRSLQ